MTERTTRTQRYGRSPRQNGTIPMIHMTLIALLLVLSSPVSAFSPLSGGARLAGTGSTRTHVGARREVPLRVWSALHFRDEDESALRDSTTLTSPDKTSKWWKSLLNRPSASDSDKVDEYLEFLDKRYHRLHDEEEASAPVPKFSALKWLQKEELEASGNSQEDALHVLGLAGLASQKLLQKHSERKETVAMVSTIPKLDSVIDAEVEKRTKSQSPLRLVLRRLSVQYYLFQRQQKVLLGTVVSFLGRQMGDASMAAKKLWTLGGGRKNIGWTVTVMAALVLLLVRPLVDGVVKATL